jgi:ABC-2 type transport system ATP-binding protein
VSVSRYAVESAGVGKTYRKKKTLGELLRRPFIPGEPLRALDGVDLQVERGEIFGLLGPNGAGKTTLIKILCSLVLPTEGRAFIEGIDAASGARARERLGLVTSDERSFYWRLTASENLRFFGRLFDLGSSRLEDRIRTLIERVGLTDSADQPLSTYSSGMRQSLAFARALLHDPPVLLLDEPTRSLDPVVARSLRRFVLEELNGRDGKTILLATHNLHEAGAVCRRIAILAKGKILAVGAPDRIRRFGLPAQIYRIEVRGTVPEDVEGWTILGLGEGETVQLEVALHQGQELGEVLSRLMTAGAVVVTCDRLEPDLEEAFERIVLHEQPPGVTGRKDVADGNGWEAGPGSDAGDRQ